MRISAGHAILRRDGLELKDKREKLSRHGLPRNL